MLLERNALCFLFVLAVQMLYKSVQIRTNALQILKKAEKNNCKKTIDTYSYVNPVGLITSTRSHPPQTVFKFIANPSLTGNAIFINEVPGVGSSLI